MAVIEASIAQDADAHGGHRTDYGIPSSRGHHCTTGDTGLASGQTRHTRLLGPFRGIPTVEQSSDSRLIRGRCGSHQAPQLPPLAIGKSHSISELQGNVANRVLQLLVALFVRSCTTSRSLPSNKRSPLRTSACWLRTIPAPTPQYPSPPTSDARRFPGP